VTGAVVFFAKTGVLGLVFIGDVSLFPLLENGKFIGCIWV